MPKYFVSRMPFASFQCIYSNMKDCVLRRMTFAKFMQFYSNMANVMVSKKTFM
jgi:hypothetical protein